MQRPHLTGGWGGEGWWWVIKRISTWLSKDKIKIQLHLKNPAIIVKEVECITSKTKGPKTVVVILTEGYDIPGSVSFDKRFNNQETLF